jgi:hypothetical protein
MFGLGLEDTPMDLTIGSKTYSFHLYAGPLRKGGRRCASVCDHRRQRILISDRVPQQVRLEVAALAVSEAWQRELVQRPPFRFVGDVS